MYRNEEQTDLKTPTLPQRLRYNKGQVRTNGFLTTEQHVPPPLTTKHIKFISYPKWHTWGSAALNIPSD
jgi:hypothetical protein